MIELADIPLKRTETIVFLVGVTAITYSPRPKSCYPILSNRPG